jgi:uncharacterized protein YcnI
LLCTASWSFAHITLAVRDAPGGSYYQAVFNVPHGCSGAATTGLTVEIPGEIISAKPQPKPGWSLLMTHEALEQPLKLESGRSMTERVSTISWQGGVLPDDEFDSFVILVHLPNRAGPLYFPTVQHCAGAETQWIDLPPPGKTTRDVPHPPPYVIIAAPRAAQ